MGLTFASLEFVFFFGTCLCLFHMTRRTSARTWLLTIFSAMFYVTFGVVGVLILTSTAVVDFIVSRRLRSTGSELTRKGWLWTGLTANLAPLVFFKYSGFFVGNIASFLLPLETHVSLPSSSVFPIVGLSYFTFAGMSYLMDVYWDTMEPARNLSEFLCYLICFPKLIAGPIARAVDFLPQFSSGFHVTARDVEIGCGYFLVGAVKKLVIADQLAGHVGMIMSAPQHFNAWTLIQGMVGYTVQIYADFSGYTDMAIGCARLLGIELPQNFLMPYSSVNIAEFWRRWHITMSTWFRDYLFLPLEMGSREIRNANVRIARNMIITMLLCGLWHGAGWNFVVWGGLHGAALTTYLIYASGRRRQAQATRSAFHPGTLVARALTLSVVMVGWVLFGCPSLTIAFQYLWRMFTWASDGVPLGSPYIIPISTFVLLIHLVIDKDRNIIEELPTYSAPPRVLTYACLLLALACMVPSGAFPFAYVRF